MLVLYGQWSLVIVQIALEPPPLLCQTGKRGKKVPKTILASPYTPGQTWGKCALNHPGKPLHPPPIRAMPIRKQHISKRGFLYLRLDIFYCLFCIHHFPISISPNHFVFHDNQCISFLLKFKVEPVQLKPTFAGRKRFGQKFSLSFQTFFDCFHSSRGISEALLVRSKIFG